MQGKALMMCHNLMINIYNGIKKLALKFLVCSLVFSLGIAYAATATAKQRTILWALIDLGNVLIAADEKYAYAELITKYNLPEERVKHFLYDTDEHNQFCRGKLTSVEYYHALLKYLQPNVAKAKLLTLPQIKHALDIAILQYDPKVLNFIKLLRQQGIKIAIVTDTHKWQSEFFRQRINFDKYADKVFESHKVGMLKSDPEYFAKIIKILKVKSEHVLLVDDNPKNNARASEIGIFAPGYKDYPKFLADIKKSTNIVIKEE
jgi:HAD superfamily hydrolase (TIGR01509 family)